MILLLFLLLGGGTSLADPSLSECESAFQQAGLGAEEHSFFDPNHWEDEYPGAPFAQVLDRVARRNLRKADGRLKLLALAEEKFQQAGVAFQKTPEGALQILPLAKSKSAGPHSLNLIAGKLKKFDPTFRLLYDPEKISFDKNQGILTFVRRKGSDFELFLGHEAAQKADAKDPLLGHEIVHAKNFYDWRRGRRYGYAVKVKASPGWMQERFGKTAVIPPTEEEFADYDQSFKLDELLAWRHNLERSSAALAAHREAKGPGFAAAASRLAGDASMNYSVGTRAQATLDLTLAGLHEMERKGKLSWNHSLRFRWNGATYHFNLLPPKGDGEGSLVVREGSGLWSARQNLVGFEMQLPAPRNGKSEFAADFVLNYLQEVQSAALQNQAAGDQLKQWSKELVHADRLSASERNDLVYRVESVVNQMQRAPGYPGR